nr:immunoglobulin heavy chain junction region [Macaca mulatta]MOW24663.1 immunoglobulin heavy chain junction region [Macaca mulatta]MOW25032.1 immunoglobulin heavy chain junction region [Macaca mulatta]MOW25403.1 immunoglobulin heavy chain junction region [Macaca mulatta]MOW25438.1 immunoglobulin heavy chain junction region [Macaca mulatta]
CVRWVRVSATGPADYFEFW